MRVAPLVFAPLLLALVGACERAPWLEKDGDVAPPAAAQTPPAGPSIPNAPPPMAALPEGNTIADVAARVTPSVVTVFSERDVARPPDPFAELFGLPQPGGPRGPRGPRGGLRERGLGSGVIVDSEEGLVITNHHVVGDADDVRVALQDGRTIAAKLVGSDPKSDVALLRLDRDEKARANIKLVAIEVADSSRLRIGDVVLAVGNPFGIGQTVTMGIISAVGRANMGLTDYEDFIQTDAAINPGNSGGALVDMAGRLVGINTAIVSQTGASAGIGFAIPSSMVLQIKDALLKHGRVVRGWMGVALQDVDAELARALDVAPPPGARGVLITDVARGSPAAKAGLMRGDLIVTVDSAPAVSSAHVRNHVAMKGKGARVTLEVLRGRDDDEKPLRLDVVLDELRDGMVAGGGRGTSAEEIAEGPLAGIVVDEVGSAASAPESDDGAAHGVVVRRAPPRSALRAGDVILEVNRRAVTTVDEFHEAAARAGDEVLLLVNRRGRTMYLLLTTR